MVKVLVVGGAGFIGSHLSRRLVGLGHEVVVFDRKPEDVAKTKIGDIWDKIRYSHGNVFIPEEDISGCDTVFLLAAERSVPKGEDFPDEFFDNNVLNMNRLFAAALKHKVRRVVFSSSSSVYGGQEENGMQHEDMTRMPKSIYALTKLMGEEICKYYADKGMCCIALRYFNVFGPGQDLENKYAVVIPKFIVNALANEAIPIHWDGEQSRDFTFVENVVDANLAAMNSPDECSGKAFNVGSGTTHTIKKLAQLIVEMTGSTSELAISGEQRAGDVKSSCGKPDYASTVLGYTCKISFEEGLKQTVEFALKEHKDGRKPF